MKFLQELQNEPIMTKEDMSESQKWKTLDDLVDMAYKIRISYEFEWEKLLEEDVIVEEDEIEQQQKYQDEKGSIHLQRYRDAVPTIGPGVLIT